MLVSSVEPYSTRLMSNFLQLLVVRSARTLGYA
jgi:hypothetical protein